MDTRKYLLRQGGRTDYNYKEYYVETEADIATIPVNEDICPGSVAFVTSTSQVFMLTPSRKWEAISSGGGGSTPGGNIYINGVLLSGDLSSTELGIIDDNNISDLSTYSSKLIQQKLNTMSVVSELVGTEAEPIIASELDLGIYIISGVVKSSSTNQSSMIVPRKEYIVNKDLAETTVLWDNNPYTASQYFIAFNHVEGEPLVKTIQLVTKEDLENAIIDCGEF